MTAPASSGTASQQKLVRAADAKEVGVGNPAEETYCHPNKTSLCHRAGFCQLFVGRGGRGVGGATGRENNACSASPEAQGARTSDCFMPTASGRFMPRMPGRPENQMVRKRAVKQPEGAHLARTTM